MSRSSQLTFLLFKLLLFSLLLLFENSLPCNKCQGTMDGQQQGGGGGGTGRGIYNTQLHVHCPLLSHVVTAGIQLQGHASFNTRLLSRLSLAPADLMHFLEACAMGNTARVEELLSR